MLQELAVENGEEGFAWPLATDEIEVIGRAWEKAGLPVVTDVTSIAGYRQRWVNISWLYELSHYGLHAAASGLVTPAEPKISPGTTI